MKYINPIYLKNGDVKLEISQMKIKSLSGKLDQIQKMDLIYQVFISTDIKDFSYMSSLCYLSKMKNSTEGFKTYLKDNEIYVSGLKSSTKYFMNIIIRNPISGELITLTPTIVETKKMNFPLIFIIIPLIIIIILIIVIYYYRKEFLVTKAVLNYEQNDIKNMENFRYESGSSSREFSSSISSNSKKSTQYTNLEDSKV